MEQLGLKLAPIRDTGMTGGILTRYTAHQPCHLISFFFISIWIGGKFLYNSKVAVKGLSPVF